jgi:hypothetical protein
LYIVQVKWIVKRRNYAATLNNRGSKLLTTISLAFAGLFCFCAFWKELQ